MKTPRRCIKIEIMGRHPTRPGRTNRRSGNYPWRQWFALTSFTITRGVHYHVRSYIMAQAARNHVNRVAKATGLDIKVWIDVADDEQSLTVSAEGYPRG